LDVALAYGPRSRRAIEVLELENSGITARHFESAQGLSLFLKSALAFGDTVLLKASRGMKIEEVRKSLEAADPSPGLNQSYSRADKKG
jgi:UDP-N-acetylmuramyl pentapeptide synthase